MSGTPRIEFIDLQAQRQRLGTAVEDAIARVLGHGRFIMGPEVATLEAALAELTGARHVVTCSSGTDALLLPLLAWGVGPGDAILVPAFTFPATPEVVALLGATPVFVDIDPVTYGINPDAIGSGIKVASDGGLRPVGIIPVDLYGQPTDTDAIRLVAAESELWVLSDAAQSLGAFAGGSAVGTHGEATATSFFPAKPLGCYGDGGAVFTDDDDLAATIRSLRVHGAGTNKYDIVRIGINGRIDTLQAAILLEKLRIFPEEIEKRQAVADRYRDGLAAVLDVPAVGEGRISTWAQYTVRLPNRDAVAARLADRGVPTAVYYPRPLHHQPAYRDAPRSGQLTAAEAAAQDVLSLPMHPYLDKTTQARIIDAVRACI